MCQEYGVILLNSIQSLESYLSNKSLLGRRIAVERNGDIVPKSQFPDVILENGDVLEIVHAIGGG